MTSAESDGATGALTPPHRTSAELEQWLVEHDLAHLGRLPLEAVAAELSPALWPQLRAASIGRRLSELTSEETLRASTLGPRFKQLLAPLVWRFFAQELEQAQAAQSERGERLSPPSDARTAALHAQLLQLRTGQPLQPARPQSQLPLTALRVEPALPGFRFVEPNAWFALPRSAGNFLRPEVVLTLGVSPRSECSCRSQRCVHQLAAIDTALLWLKQAPNKRFLEQVSELTKAPWERTLQALGQAMESARARPALDLRFRLGVVSDEVRIEAWLHKQDKHGKELTPSAVSRKQLLERYSVELSARDRAIVALLTDTGAPASRALLESLSGHPQLVLASAPDQAARIDRAAVGLVAEERNGALRLTAGVDGTALPTSLCQRIARAKSGDLLFLFDGARLSLLDAKPAVSSALQVLVQQGDLFPAEAQAALLSSLSSWAREVPVAMPRSVLGEAALPTTTPVLRLAAQANGAVHVEVLVRPLDAGPSVVPGRGVRDLHLRRGDKAVHVVRDFAQELAATKQLIAELPLATAEPLEDLPFQYRYPSAQGALQLLAVCAERTLVPEVEWVGLPVRLLGTAQVAMLRVMVKRRSEWFGVLGGLSVEGERVELGRLLDAVRRRERYVELDGRGYLELDEALRNHLALLADHVRPVGEQLELGPSASSALHALERAGAQLDRDGVFCQLEARTSAAMALMPAVPSGLTSELRSYQIEGYRWLVRLAESAAGAILADDMGLGKTVQALALLLERSQRGPALVVVPTSVAFNWRAEAQRFAPGLTLRQYGAEPTSSGERRERAELLSSLGPGEVVLVSYALLLRDREAFAKVAFATAIFDEAQNLKNATSQRFRAAKGLKIEFSVALSGTPMENHLGELWSLFHLVYPQLLGSWESFRRRFAAPIEKQLDPEAAPALGRVIAPFLLRRTKLEVEAELPARTEISVPVTLSTNEWQLYEDARLAALSDLETRKSKLREQERRVEVLAALTRLRLLASHPRLYDERSLVVSSKLERLLRLCAELRAQGQRALIFSQFTSHLGLVREALEQSGLEYLYLDGSTPAKARGELVRDFQEGSAPLFLISLKAGGVGLNLTAASNVILLDPWWNPAVEDQAADRAHRPGQTKPVTIYRLISLGTIEEQMLNLHAQKRALVSKVLLGERAPAGLGAEELVELLRGNAAASAQ